MYTALTKKQIESKVNKTITKVNKDIEQIKALAEKKNIYVDIKTYQEANKAINKEFEFLRFDHNSIQYINGSNGIINKIYSMYNNQEYYLSRYIQVQTINDKKQEITLSAEKYYINIFFETINIKAEFIKEFKSNPNKVYKIADKEEFKKLVSIVRYTNPVTEKILKAITPDIKEKHKAYLKEKYCNKYNTIWKIKDSLGIEGNQYDNSFLILEELSK